MTTTMRINKKYIYPMTSKVRGFCIIIHNHGFEDHEIFGTISEVDQFQNIIEKLGFVVKRYDDLTKEKMLNILEENSRSEELRHHNAFALFILSHGNSEGIFGIDERCVELRVIKELFNGNNCPHLNHKPKMIFITACRGCKLNL
jgi:hypothetical protein